MFCTAVLLFGCTTARVLDDRAPSTEVKRTPSAVPGLAPIYHAFRYGIRPNTPASCSLDCDELTLWAGVRDPRPGEEAAAAHPETIEALLHLIRERRPEYLSYHTFAYESFSLQTASFNNPRALVFGCDAKTVLTFNGLDRQKGYERLEVACANDQTKAIEFREITFPKEARVAPEELTSEQLKRNAVLSPVNGFPGRSCTQCHQSPARHAAGTPSVGGRTFRRVRRQQPAPRRYAWLPAEKSPDHRPNDTLGTLLYYRNGERLVAELKALGDRFRSQRYRFLRALTCSGARAIGQSKPTPQTSPRAREILLEIYDYVGTKLAYLDKKVGRSVMSRLRGSDYETTSEKRWRGFYLRTTTFTICPAKAAQSTMTRIKPKPSPHWSGSWVPLGVDLQNWSLNMNGGHAYGSGQAGYYLTNLQSMLEYPLLDNFFADDPRGVGGVHGVSQYR